MGSVARLGISFRVYPCFKKVDFDLIPTIYLINSTSYLINSTSYLFNSTSYLINSTSYLINCEVGGDK